MSQPNRPESVDTEDPEAFFHRTMAGATGILWERGLHHEGLAALHDVIEYAIVQREAGEDRHGDLPE